jgi:hypothetical protein
MRRYAKGYKKMFFYMIDVAIFNSCALQKKITGKKQHFTEFRIQLAELMIESAVLPNTLDVAGHSRALPLSVFRLFIGPTLFSLFPQSKKKNPCRDCVVCTAKKKKSETRYECSKCLVALHVPDCFRVYHTTKNI